MIKEINMYLGTEQDSSLIDVWMAYVEGEHETVSESIQTLFTATAEDNYKILVVCTGFFCPKHEPSPTAWHLPHRHHSNRRRRQYTATVTVADGCTDYDKT